jgi:hypothetical protein
MLEDEYDKWIVSFLFSTFYSSSASSSSLTHSLTHSLTDSIALCLDKEKHGTYGQRVGIVQFTCGTYLKTIIVIRWGMPS